MSSRHPRPARARAGVLLASSFAAGFGVVLASGAAQTVTATPAVLTSVTRPAQLWETHAWHLAHLAHLAAVGGGSGVVLVSHRGGDADGDSDGSGGGVAAQAPVSAASSTVSAASGSFQACVIARESGGQSQVMNSTGHYGLYQFAEATWVANGGSPATFGHASVAEQNQVFANTMAKLGGALNWTPYDGCR